MNPNWRWTDQHQAVLSTCSSLIAIVDDKGSQIVQFSHFSVKEYLTSDRPARSSGDVSRYYIPLESAHTTLAQACLGALLRLDDRVNKHNVGDIPLVECAARHWVGHAQFENVASRIRDAMEYFFDADKPHWTSWRQVQKTDVWWESFGIFQPESGATFPLYYASLGGFYDLAEHLVGKHPEQINAKGGLMLTPLVAALAGKHFQIAELLHRNGAEVDFCDNLENTLLWTACIAGALDVAQWLLDHGADTSIPNEGLWTPVHKAAADCSLRVLKMLLEHNADIHVRTNLGKSPLHMATSFHFLEPDHVDIMQVLLDHGADPNARDDDYSTPLHDSSWWQGVFGPRVGTVEGTRLLLKYGAIIDAEDYEGRTPLQLALEHGRHEMAACLKEHGAKR